MGKLTVEELKGRALLRPGECVKVYGLAVETWKRLFDEGKVGGFWDSRSRWILSSSAAAYVGVAVDERREEVRRRPADRTEYFRQIHAAGLGGDRFHDVSVAQVGEKQQGVGIQG